MRFTLSVPLLLATGLSAQLGLSSTNGVSPEPAIEVPYNATLIPASGLTLEAWITYDETKLGTGWRWPTIVRMNQNAGRESYFFRIGAWNNNRRNLDFFIRTSAGNMTVSWSFAAGGLKSWTHVAATYDGQNARIFVNGKQVATRSTFNRGKITDLENGKGTLRIGNGATVANAKGIELWQGEIDEVRIWPFARTAAEITSTMNLALRSVPGEVSTWNLDLKPTDTSGKNNGKDLNKPTYAKNTLKLTALLSGASSFGRATPACSGMPRAGINTMAKINNKDFVVTCIRGGANKNGVMWGGLGKLSTSVKLLGTDLWVDTAQIGFLFATKSNAEGVARVPAAIPNLPIFAGLQLHAQFLFEDPSCTTARFSASDGLTVTLLK